MPLRANEFDAFHTAVHGRPPFSWQTRLLSTITERREWPSVLDLPTGAGKTTCIDIALFALALDAARPSNERWCARRIAMVVDRRVVVDQAAERGRLLLRQLTNANDGILLAVAEALRSLVHDDEDALGVYTLRGGIAKDDGWARTPHQPLILASTVDQFGSRLLMQGYGVSPSMRPVHAGLLANDTLLLLDEVHLSFPFAETLENLAALRSRTGQAPARPLQHVMLSATPGDTPGHVFCLTAPELDEEGPLRQRLQARKPTRLQEIATRADLPNEFVTLVGDLLQRHDVCAVVANRVDTARQTAALLRKQLECVDVLLLTGRMRPLDRDDALADFQSRFVSGRSRSSGARKLVVVATQCIEAGADFDFDALATESASLDALRQRFGRVDRLGVYGKAEGVIVHVRQGAKDDPVYGAALPTTWKWLGDQSDKKRQIDFGIAWLPSPSGDLQLATPRRRAATILPAYLDLWAQTAPSPAIVPDVPLFLHGLGSGPADVQIIWRADLLDVHFEAGNDTARAVVQAMRPSSLEAVSVPFAVARRWLAGDVTDLGIIDVEGSQIDAGPASAVSGLALRWRGEKSDIVDDPKDVRPGDTLIVPSTRGGLSYGTFDPTAKGAVTDLAERAVFLSRGRAMVRLHPKITEPLGLGSIAAVDDLRSALGAVADDEKPWKALWREGLSGKLRRVIVEPGAPFGDRVRWTVVEGRRFSPDELRATIQDAEPGMEFGSDISTDDEESVYVGQAGITLAQHSRNVERFAARYSQQLGLPKSLASDLALAGWLHDVGKADPRFQLLLRGGDRIEFYKDETVWAKSSVPAGDLEERIAARERSAYPRNARHELQSVAMLESVRNSVGTIAADFDLVLHLVGSHHGHCRPFAPASIDAAPVAVSLDGHHSAAFGKMSFESVPSSHELHRLDSTVAERFWSLIARYGWFELCWLESILRLADHRASELEEIGEGGAQ